ncbi:S-adenosyl methyltransferase [Frankia sp. AiPs1]|uniref:SAM-dependent methyltransferase n=1 Tax=Frankia sp. AiPa1 TaxID=573492 RepID=UPI00202AED17|nr:SAM-dependent methyltransferase [Frankia sp. AiPa1]MCL9759173.1 SAM-dependent methyltransferase [Frankia sp. AiPa1]
MADVPEWATGVDVDRPSAARIYDYALGGSHNFAADREAYADVVTTFPDAPLVARSNRLFLHRAVRHIVTDLGVTQFLDLGSGVPTVGNVHQIAQNIDPRARVVYVEIDPVAVAHAEILLADNPRATMLRADVRDPAAILRSEQVTSLLDLSRPVAVLMVTVLHFIPDADSPAGIVRAFRDATVPGSAVAVSHLIAGDWDDESGNVEQVYNRTSTGINPRSRAEIAGLLDGYDLVEPGLVYSPLWRPDPGPAGLDPLTDDPARSVALAAVGRR